MSAAISQYMSGLRNVTCLMLVAVAVAISAPPHLGDWLMRPVCELLQHRNRTELILGKIIPMLGVR